MEHLWWAKHHRKPFTCIIPCNPQKRLTKNIPPVPDPLPGTWQVLQKYQSNEWMVVPLPTTSARWWAQVAPISVEQCFTGDSRPSTCLAPSGQGHRGCYSHGATFLVGVHAGANCPSLILFPTFQECIHCIWKHRTAHFSLISYRVYIHGMGSKSRQIWLQSWLFIHLHVTRGYLSSFSKPQFSNLE